MTKRTPTEAGQRVATFFERTAPILFADLVQSGALPGGDDARAQARDEWDCYALFGCVRGIVAAGGFARRTADAIDALHGVVFAGWDAAALGGMDTVKRALLGRRYEEYETISQAGGAAGAADVATRLGAEAARRMIGESPPQDVIEILGSMHEILAESVVSLLNGEGGVPSA